MENIGQKNACYSTFHRCISIHHQPWEMVSSQPKQCKWVTAALYFREPVLTPALHEPANCPGGGAGPGGGGAVQNAPLRPTRKAERKTNWKDLTDIIQYVWNNFEHFFCPRQYRGHPRSSKVKFYSFRPFRKLSLHLHYTSWRENTKSHQQIFEI